MLMEVRGEQREDRSQELLLIRGHGQERYVGDSLGEGEAGPMSADSETKEVLGESAPWMVERDRR